MDARLFWEVIGTYNQQTGLFQLVLLILVLSSVGLSYRIQAGWPAKVTLGVVNLFIGFVFFGFYGTEPIQKFFALPLYILCGGLLVYESVQTRDDKLEKPNRWQCVLYGLYLLYPAISLALGNVFPEMVTHIMPCPVMCLSLTVYSCFGRKNRLLLLLMTVWGLTGVKSILFCAYEDIILLVCGVYGIVLLIKDKKGRRHQKVSGHHEIF